MSSDGTTDFYSAINDFHSARNQAMLQSLLSRFTGASTELLSYEEVRQKLKIQGSAELGVQDIPLDAIVGSAGRYSDFTRGFLPRKSVNPERWARVRAAASSLVGLPPIEVYKIGEAYFVKDGNHRVSVARQLGATHIQAYVTEIRTRVPLTPDVEPDDLILMAEYADFLEETHLDQLRPQADLRVTVPGQYPVIKEHINVHRYFMGIDEQREISYPEAVAHWYDQVYMPVVQSIRELGILHNFPGRTETDLYLWIAGHKAQLEEELGWKIKSEAAVIDLAKIHPPPTANPVVRLGERLLDVLDTLTSGALEAGPPPGQWRKEVLATHHNDRLFVDILVPVSGKEGGWRALDQALVIAEREGAVLHGLHVVTVKDQEAGPEAEAARAEFNRRCATAGVAGDLVITSGDVSREICTRARLADLIVANLNYPPSPQPLARLTSSWRELIQRCPPPILTVPQAMTSLRRPLLAFDGSPKSQEALFAATYLAGRWKIPLSVLTVLENGRSAPEALFQAMEYLEKHGVHAEGRVENGPAAQTILHYAEQHENDFILIGGYGFQPVLEVMLGSAVDELLRLSRLPILICR